MATENKKPSNFSKLIQKINPWAYPTGPAGYVLPGAGMPTEGLVGKQIPDQNAVRMMEPPGSIPNQRIDRTTGFSQIQNLSHKFSMAKVQAALRSAENGEPRMLFSFYRDFFIGSGTVVSALSKRKLSTLSEPYVILPHEKGNKDDEYAAQVINDVLSKTPNLIQAFSHMMNSVVYPVALVEKTFDTPEKLGWNDNKFNLRYGIKALDAVDYNIVSYRVAYVPQAMGFNMMYNGIGNTVAGSNLSSLPLVSANNAQGMESMIYDPDEWESSLRLWPVMPNGMIIQSPAQMLKLDPNRIMVYRSNLLNGLARENFGGLGRSLLFLTIMSQVGIDVFLKCLQKFGKPIIIAKTNTAQVDTVNAIVDAFNQNDVVNALGINLDAEVQLAEMNYNGAADAHDKFIQLIDDKINSLICGESLSSHKSTGGLGTGKDSLQGSVREDIIQFDRLSLNETLKSQLFKYILEWNGIKGNCPNIRWGGGSSISDNKDLSVTILNLYNAGIQPSDDSLTDLGEKIGLQLERVGIEEEENPNESENKFETNEDAGKSEEDKKDE